MTNQIGCVICYQSVEEILEQDCKYDECSYCEQSFCHDCFKEWMIQQIKSKHFKRLDKVLLKCQQEKCENTYKMSQIANILDQERFYEVDRVLTQKLLRANDSFINCPNSACGNYGFLEDVCCPNNIECTNCNAHFKLSCQPHSSFRLSNYLSIEALYNSNTYSDLYKVLFAQMCPSCKVMIVRSEGCKFMECAKCQYQFCWNCLSEFYTEYHYYESMCPLRIVPIYGVVSISLLFLVIKMFYQIDFLNFLVKWIFSAVFSQLIGFGLTVLLIASYRKFYLLYELVKQLNISQKTLQNQRGGRAQITKLKDNIKNESLVTALLMIGTIALMALIRQMNQRMMPGIGPQVVKSVPIHLIIVGFGKLIKWYSSR
ncbi:ibr domain containing protein [Stylonychia lemnae]|uniref:Ibr domain containing protein n=1 Tax=Stylonychia lemnae TaxID=5949 RepID=A0A078AVT6_STYLE|nr:ibr domain containing protein [Stylonychia lemnae]|eukprot:CDW86540.1 ibr domain containing protein [Stylonychia lemnae]